VNKPGEIICETVREEKGKLYDYVGKLEHNDKWIAVIELLPTYSRENRKNVCLLSDISHFVSWEHRHWNYCLQSENHEKTHQLFNRKYGNV